MSGKKTTLRQNLAAFWEENRESRGKILVESWIFCYNFKDQFILPSTVPILAFLALFDTVAHVTLFPATVFFTKASQLIWPWAVLQFPWILKFPWIANVGTWGGTIEIVLNVLVALGSVIVWLDHRQLTSEKLISKQTMNVLHWLSSAQFWESGGGSLENRVTSALKGITNALELPGSEEGMANATILISHYRGDELGFRIFAQDPSNAFPPDEFIPLEGTLAGQVSQRPAEGDCSSLHAYVPWTRYSSGISFKYEKMSGGKDREILQGESGVYKKLSEQSQLSMGCLLCTGIDLDPELTEKLAIMYGINDPTFVLCFSNRRANSLGESSRHAIVVASKLLPRIFEAL